MEETAIAADRIKIALAGRIDSRASWRFDFSHEFIGVEIDHGDRLRRRVIQHQQKAIVVRHHAQARVA